MKILFNLAQRRAILRWYWRYGVVLDAVLMVVMLSFVVQYSVRVFMWKP